MDKIMAKSLTSFLAWKNKEETRNYLALDNVFACVWIEWRILYLLTVCSNSFKNKLKVLHCREIFKKLFLHHILNWAVINESHRMDQCVCVGMLKTGSAQFLTITRDWEPWILTTYSRIKDGPFPLRGPNSARFSFLKKYIQRCRKLAMRPFRDEFTPITHTIISSTNRRQGSVWGENLV